MWWGEGLEPPRCMRSWVAEKQGVVTSIDIPGILYFVICRFALTSHGLQPSWAVEALCIPSNLLLPKLAWYQGHDTSLGLL